MLKFSIFLMKRLLILVSLIFISFLATAQTNQNIDNITNIAQNISTASFKTATNQALNKEIALPGWADIIARVLFGVEDKITFSNFIILVAVWLMLFLMIFNIIKLMPFFKGDTVKLIASICITLIIAISKVMITLSEQLLSFVSSFKFFKDWSAGALFFSIVLVVVVFFFLIKVLNKIGDKMEVGAAESAGDEAGAGLGIMKVISRVFSKQSK